MSAGRGVCPDCGRAMQIRLDGAIRRHRNNSDLPCTGSGAPVSEARSASAPVKFVDDLPSSRRQSPILVELRKQPGRWAEVGRYKSRGSAASRGHQLGQRHADIEYSTRKVDDEVVLFLRSVAS